MLISEVTEEPKAKKAKGQANSSTDPDDFEVHGARSFPSGLMQEERHGGSAAVGKAKADAKSTTRPEPVADEEEEIQQPY